MSGKNVVICLDGTGNHFKEHNSNVVKLFRVLQRDTGTQVSDLYTGIFKFNGKLDRVIFTVSDENTVPPRELPAMYY